MTSLSSVGSRWKGDSGWGGAEEKGGERFVRGGKVGEVGGTIEVCGIREVGEEISS
jgi:hypothetical protein